MLAVFVHDGVKNDDGGDDYQDDDYDDQDDGKANCASSSTAPQIAYHAYKRFQCT